jgi:hypothetical protein
MRMKEVEFVLHGSVSVRKDNNAYENSYILVEMIRELITMNMPTVELKRHYIVDADGGEWDDGS